MDEQPGGKDDDVARSREAPSTGSAEDVGAAAFGMAILGFLASWVVMFVALVVDESGAAGWYIAGTATVGLIAFLIPRRTRQAATGAGIGFAVGFIIGAGVCAAWLGSWV